MIVELQLNCTGGWVDYSKWVNITRLIRELSLNSDNDPQKEQTGTIELFGDAYTFVEANLISGANMYSNSMCVRITDNVCSGAVYLFKIDNKNLKWCDDNGCTMEFEMQAYEPELDCIRNTTIADNTNHVFDKFGPIIHPRFRYCDVIKPTLFFNFIMVFASIVDIIILFINNTIIPAINLIPGVSVNPINLLGNLLSGCDRGYPSPFIRTYIDNVCTLCSLSADITTAPIFYDTQNPLTPAETNPYYNAALMTAYAKKGVKMTTNESYIINNQPSWTLTAFLGYIKTMWNARWFIYNNKVYFHRKDKIGELIWGTTPALDLTGDDAKKLINGVCFSWNGEGKIKRLYMKYGKDASDAVGNEVLNRFNGEYLNTSTNVNYTEAIEIENREFGATSFVLDGNDSQYDAILLLSVTGIFGTYGLPGILKTTTDTCSLAKILCYNPATTLSEARVVSAPLTLYQLLTSFIDDDSDQSIIVSAMCKNYNYPMSFSPSANAYNKNLWQYHEIDVPSPSKKTNIAFEFTLQYCCEFSTLNLYQKVVMKNGDIGEISSVEFDHFNRTINVKGNLI